jgi:hypothetical protein
MTNPTIAIIAASITLAALTFAAPPASAADPAPAAPRKPHVKERELGGKMPLPVDQRLERENKPSDKLIVEVTHSAPESTHYIAYVKIVWGDLDNLLKGISKQYYSNWDGALILTDATGAIDEKIQFDDKTGQHKSIAVTRSAARNTARPARTVDDKNRRVAGPHEGSGRDQVEDPSGPRIDWKAGVVGALDGLRIKITSDSPTIHATLTAGKFEIPLTITPDTATPAATPALKK